MCAWLCFYFLSLFDVLFVARAFSYFLFARACIIVLYIQLTLDAYIPLISRVRGPYGKLWTEFFPSFYGPSAKRAGHENKEGKNEDP